MSSRTIGIATLLALVLFAVFAGLYFHRAYFKGWTDRVIFSDDIGNLKLDNPVKVRGLNVGVVTAIGRQGKKARLVVRMRDDVDIRTDYALFNRDAGLMGDRGLFLHTGRAGVALPVDSPLYAEFVPGIAEGIRNADSLGAVIYRLHDLVNRYGRVDPKNDTLFTTQFKKLLREINRATERIDAMVSDKEPVIGRFVRETSAFTSGLRTQAVMQKPRIEAALVKTTALSADALVQIEKLTPILEKLSQIVAETESGANLPGKLIADRGTYKKINELLEKIHEVLTTLSKEGVGIDIDFF